MNRFRLFLTIALITAISSCKNESYSDTPEAALKQYFAAANSGKPGSSINYATKSSAEIIRFLESDPSSKDKTDEKNISYRKVDIQGDKAIASTYNTKTKTTTFYILRKEDGKWKVDMSKEGLQETSRLSLEHVGINVDDLQAGKIPMDSVKKIMQEYQRLHPNGE